jgi:hypothetical protein
LSKRKLVISTTKGLVLLTIIVLVISAVLSVFNSYLYTKTFEKLEIKEIKELFENGVDFSGIAKNLLQTRREIAYVKLKNESGALEQSFGTENGEGINDVEINTPENKIIVVGLRRVIDKDLIISNAVWSVLIGIGLVLIFLVLFMQFSSDQSRNLERLISAMKRVSPDNLDTKLTINESIQDDVAMIRAYDSFNQMMSRLKRKGRAPEAEESINFEPKVLISETEKKSNLRDVTALVTKIYNFEDLLTKIDSVEFTNFLTDFRKTASSIVSDYNGTIEALLQEEIVALFNAPDEQDNPELRAVCAAVEVLQVLANMNKKRKAEGKDPIGGKVGIAVRPIQFYDQAGIPQGVKEVISEARVLSGNAPLWKVIVSEGIYDTIKDHVEVKGIPWGNEQLYSIVSVEEGIINV